VWGGGGGGALCRKKNTPAVNIMEEFMSLCKGNIYGVSPSHVPYLLSKSDFGPSSAKPGI
jgi:hypothetical protein